MKKVRKKKASDASIDPDRKCESSVGADPDEDGELDDDRGTVIDASAMRRRLEAETEAVLAELDAVIPDASKVARRVGEESFCAMAADRSAEVAASTDTPPGPITRPLRSTDVTESLFVKLTPDEVNTRARKAADMRGEAIRVESEMKDASSQYKTELKKINSEIDTLTSAARSGREYQRVACQQVFDAKNNKTWFVFRGEEYGHRPMNMAEGAAFSQRSLFNDETEVALAALRPEHAASLEPEKPDVAPKKPRVRMPKGEGVRIDSMREGSSTFTHTDAQAQDNDIRDVMRDEKSVRGKKDHSL